MTSTVKLRRAARPASTTSARIWWRPRVVGLNVKLPPLPLAASVRSVHWSDAVRST
jgi:hypothetical protein